MRTPKIGDVVYMVLDQEHTIDPLVEDVLAQYSLDVYIEEVTVVATYTDMSHCLVEARGTTWKVPIDELFFDRAGAINECNGILRRKINILKKAVKIMKNAMVKNMTRTLERKESI